MKTHVPFRWSLILAGSLSLIGGDVVFAQSGGEKLSGPQLAAQLNNLRQDGPSYVRMRLETPSGTLQIQGKQRRTKGSTELVYQVLWPKNRKGEALLLRESGGRFSGAKLSVSGEIAQFGAGDAKEAFFGSALANADVVENFFAWESQEVVGSEKVNGAECQILESKPGKAGSIYTSVRTWVDTRRMVPMRVEKYAGGSEAVRRIDTTKVVNDDRGRPIPANLRVRGPGGATSDLDGSKIQHNVVFSDAEFTPEGLKNAGLPRTSDE